MEKHLSSTIVLVCTLSTLYEVKQQILPGQVLPCALVLLVG
jgi:hypothetical protein